MTESAIELRIDPRDRPVGAGRVRRLLPHRTRRMVGPFIFADLIGPESLAPGSGINVDAHPHIGMSTVTYLFDGRMVHRDSTGGLQTIEPGAVNWMTAGSGVAHTERSHPDDVTTTRPMHGLQTWVALPTDSYRYSDGVSELDIEDVLTFEAMHVNEQSRSQSLRHEPNTTLRAGSPQKFSMVPRRSDSGRDGS